MAWILPAAAVDGITWGIGRLAVICLFVMHARTQSISEGRLHPAPDSNSSKSSRRSAKQAAHPSCLSCGIGMSRTLTDGFRIPGSDHRLGWQDIANGEISAVTIDTFRYFMPSRLVLGRDC